MAFFTRLLDAVFGKEYLEPQPTMAALKAYLPPGDLDVLWRWQVKNLPYERDIDPKTGAYDKYKEYNGGDLTLRDGKGDCESLAAVFSEVIRDWKGWRSSHLYFQFTNRAGELKGHDVATFCTPSGKMGWLEAGEYGGVYFGGIDRIRETYADAGCRITKWYKVNDMGERLDL